MHEHHEKERPMTELSGFPYAEVRFDIRRIGCRRR